MKLISFLPVNYQEICPAWTPWHLNEGRKFKSQKNEDYYIEFYRLKLISPCNNQHKYYLHIQAGVLLLKEFILNFHRYNPEGFYKPSDFHHSAPTPRQFLHSVLTEKKNCWRPVMTWAQSHIRMTAYQILLVAAGFFWVLFSFCFVFIRLLGFVSCAYKWSCKRPINAHFVEGQGKTFKFVFLSPENGWGRDWL